MNPYNARMFAVGPRPLSGRTHLPEQAPAPTNNTESPFIRRLFFGALVAMAAGAIYEYTGPSHEDRARVAYHDAWSSGSNNKSTTYDVEMVLVGGDHAGGDASYHTTRDEWQSLKDGDAVRISWREGRITGQRHVSEVLGPDTTPAVTARPKSP